MVTTKDGVEMKCEMFFVSLSVTSFVMRMHVLRDQESQVIQDRAGEYKEFPSGLLIAEH